MDAEQIVRALAASDPVAQTDEHVWCVFCECDSYDPGQHRKDCPWRLAREWAAQRTKPLASQLGFVANDTKGVEVPWRPDKYPR